MSRPFFSFDLHYVLYTKATTEEAISALPRGMISKEEVIAQGRAACSQLETSTHRRSTQWLMHDQTSREMALEGETGYDERELRLILFNGIRATMIRPLHASILDESTESPRCVLSQADVTSIDDAEIEGISKAGSMTEEAFCTIRQEMFLENNMCDHAPAWPTEHSARGYYERVSHESSPEEWAWGDYLSRPEQPTEYVQLSSTKSRFHRSDKDKLAYRSTCGGGD